MSEPQASTSEVKVRSRYWAGESRARTARGRSLPARSDSNKRAAPGCDGLTGLAAEQLRRKHARTFDFTPAQDLEVPVKDEQNAPTQTTPSHSPLTLTNRSQLDLPRSTTGSPIPIEPLPPTAPVPLSPPPPPVKPSSSTRPTKDSSQTVAVKPAGRPFDTESWIKCRESLAETRSHREEEAVISTLAHVCDQAVTEATINLILRWGREAPHPPGESDDLGIAYLQGIVARIDKHGIEPDRRVVVTDLLTSKLNQHLEGLRSRIVTLRAPRLPLPSSPNLDRLVRPNGDATETDRQIVVPPSRSSVHQGSNGEITPSGSRHRPDYQINSADDIGTDHDPKPSPAKSLTGTNNVTMSKKVTLPKQAFDVFQEAALAARNFTAEEKGEMPEFQRHIKSVWRKVQSCQRNEWQELLRIRRTCTDVSTKSHGLLESQSLLMDFVPDYHLRTQHPRPHGTEPLTTDSVGPGPSIGTDQSVTPSTSKASYVPVTTSH